MAGIAGVVLFAATAAAAATVAATAAAAAAVAVAVAASVGSTPPDGTRDEVRLFAKAAMPTPM